MRLKKPVDLYLIGVGILGLKQISAEAESAIRSCRKIFHLTSVHGQLKKLCGEVVDNAEYYWTGESGSVVYQRIVARVLDEARRGPTVGNVIYGHPLFFDDINMSLIALARENGLRYKVIPGVSSLDTLSTDLEIDYGDGLQVYEAADLVYSGHPLNPKVHAVILQIGQFGSNLTIQSIPSPKGRFTVFQQHLMKYYPADHKVIVALSDRGDIGYRKFQFECKIAEMDDYRKKIFKGTTLYIPPLE